MLSTSTMDTGNCQTSTRLSQPLIELTLMPFGRSTRMPTKPSRTSSGDLKGSGQSSTRATMARSSSSIHGHPGIKRKLLRMMSNVQSWATSSCRSMRLAMGTASCKLDGSNSKLAGPLSHTWESDNIEPYDVRMMWIPNLFVSARHSLSPIVISLI